MRAVNGISIGNGHDVLFAPFIGRRCGFDRFLSKWSGVENLLSDF